MARRISIQQKFAILETIKNYSNFPKSRIIAIVGVMNYRGLEYFDWFIQNDFIRPNNRGFVCTQKAHKALQDWRILCELMGESSECLK